MKWTWQKFETLDWSARDADDLAAAYRETVDALSEYVAWTRGEGESLAYADAAWTRLCAAIPADYPPKIGGAE